MRLTRCPFAAVAFLIFALAGAFTVGGWVAAERPARLAAPAAPPAFKIETPANRGLDANLYIQTAAEFRACCYQAYNLATFRLKMALEKKPEGKLAVIADLDETIFDNAGFQAMLLRSGLAYDQRIWDLWEEKNPDQVALVPGAKEFLLKAITCDVTVFYISNRHARFRDQARRVFTNFDIPAPSDSQFKFRTTTTDKQVRRQEVEKEYNVLLYLGDNLRDFDETFRCPPLDRGTPEELQSAIQQRNNLCDRHRADWGEKWIILPNPVYGEWMKPLGRWPADLDRLAPPISAKER